MGCDAVVSGASRSAPSGEYRHSQCRRKGRPPPSV